MNKGNKKATAYIILALYIAQSIFPVFEKQFPAVKWLVSVSALSACLWRGRDYVVNASDESDNGNSNTKSSTL